LCGISVGEIFDEVVSMRVSGRRLYLFLVGVELRRKMRTRGNKLVKDSHFHTQYSRQ
jgi:hypothetical protein